MATPSFTEDFSSNLRILIGSASQEIAENQLSTESSIAPPVDNGFEAKLERSSEPQVLACKEEVGPTQGSDRYEGPDTIRVRVDVLDHLMNFVGELVLIRNQFLQAYDRQATVDANLAQRLDLLTSEMQSQVMKTRMQPVGNSLKKLHGFVADLSRDLGKSVELVVQGGDTELDQGLMDAIGGPLLHIVRNSIEHGIECEAERSISGKPCQGVLTIRAFHEAGHVVVAVADDGRGFDTQKILCKALELGLCDGDDMARIEGKEGKINELSYEMGLSTASGSGGGCGLHVVKSTVEKIGGNVHLDSHRGTGAEVRLTMPLTSAIVPALIVEGQGQKFAIPQAQIVEILQANESPSSPRIEGLQDRPVLRLRGDLVPLVSLEETLFMREVNDREEKKSPKAAAESLAAEVSSIPVVVLKVEACVFGVIVDGIVDSIDIVVKPLADFLKSLEIYSGATVMGDGEVALALDPTGIADFHGMNLRQAGSLTSGASTASTASQTCETTEYLIFDVGAPNHYAMPLEHVHRLEEFPAEAMEVVGKTRVVQYGDSILPLVSLGSCLGFADGYATQEGPIPVIVFRRNTSSFGFVVKKILDVQAKACPLDTGIRGRREIKGSLVDEGEVIVVVDADEVVGEFENSFAGVRNRVERSQAVS